MAAILVLIHHARAEPEWFSLHWYLSKHHHLLPHTLSTGKVREQDKEKRKALTKSGLWESHTQWEALGCCCLTGTSWLESLATLGWASHPIKWRDLHFLPLPHLTSPSKVRHKQQRTHLFAQVVIYLHYLLLRSKLFLGCSPILGEVFGWIK